MPAVGYEHPDQSHFVSRHFYEVGALDPRLGTGWLGRYLDRVGSPDNPLQGLALDSSLAPALATARVPVAAVDSPTSYDFWARDVWGEVDDADARRHRADRRRARARRAGARPGRRRRDAHRRAARPARPAARRRRTSPRSRSPVAYPASEESDFPERLAALAAMLGAGLPLRCVAITAPGDYDTHANQVELLGEPLKLTCDALAAFQRDLEARGLADRVLVHVWSEFGRRAEENSEGTDHGAAGLGLLIGTRAAGRMIGEFPGLDTLDDHGQPARHVGLPRRLRGAAGAVARHRGGGHRPRRRPGRAAAARQVKALLGGAARAGGARPRRRRRAGADAGHRRRVDAAHVAAQPCRRGGLQIQLYNRGEDAHDIAARRVDRLGRRVGRTFRIRETRPGELAEATWRLRSGKYRLWCTLRGHESAGMRAGLRVR